MPHDDTAVRIPLRAKDGSVRAYAIIDADDAEFAQQWRWTLSGGYAVRQVQVGGRPRTLSLHRALLGLTFGDGVEVDHVDRDKLNNRRSNLRIGTHAQNTQNMSVQRGRSSIYRGVTWFKANQKWGAYLRANGEQRYLGLFATEAEAAEVAREARRRLMPFAVD